jgi:5-methylcytosine-specific restriction enzyme A
MPRKPAIFKPTGYKPYSFDTQRGHSGTRGYGYKWRQARAIFLKRNPLCKHCADLGRVTPAQAVDHITPHKGDSALFWNKSNWQALCKRCHDSKTARHDSNLNKKQPQKP